jgi:hypothetical protein
MKYQEETFHKLSYPGAIDADGHFIEGPKLWLEYSEAKYKPRALQFKWTSDGVQYLEINGQSVQDLALAPPSAELFSAPSEIHAKTADGIQAFPTVNVPTRLSARLTPRAASNALIKKG